MDRDRELSAALADNTRFLIYRWIAEKPGTDVTVADVADEFGLHPNVARMHLAKLERQASWPPPSVARPRVADRRSCTG